MKITDIISWILIILIVAKNRVMTKLGYDPNRARDLWGYYVIFISLFIITELISKGGLLINYQYFILGSVVGIPTGLLGNKYMIARIKSNVLSSKGQTINIFMIMLVISVPLIILQTWFMLKSEMNAKLIVDMLGKIILPYTFGTMLTGMITMLIDILKYKKSNGILYLKEKTE